MLSHKKTHQTYNENILVDVQSLWSKLSIMLCKHKI